MGNKFQLKRTSVSGRTPNTTNSANTSYIDAGELAINLADGKMFSSNGSAIMEFGAGTPIYDENGNLITTSFVSLINPTSISSHLIPSANITYDLGTANNRWRDLYLSNNTLHLGDLRLSANATTLTITDASNTTSVVGTGGNASTVGGNSAADLRTYSDTVAGTAYTNAVAQATSLAGTAYSNAVSTAAADATTKAATAFSNATSTAAADATTKAATAYSNAVSVAATDASTKAATAYSNAVSTAATDASTKAATAYSNAVSTILAGSTFTGAVTMQANLTANNVRLYGDMQIDGNLTVSGTSVTLNVSSLAVEDNMIYLNNGSQVSNPDLGIAGNYNDGTYKHAGIFRDATDGRWKFFHEYTPEPDASAYIDTANASFALANVQAHTFIGAGNLTSLAVSGTISSGNTTITGFANVSSTLQVTGATTLSSTLAAGNTTITGSVSASAGVSANGSAANSGDVNTMQLKVLRNSTVDFTIGSDATNVYLQSWNSKPLFINNQGNPVTFSTAVSGITTLAAGNTTITGFANVSSTLQVTGVSTFSNTMNVAGLITGTITLANNASNLGGVAAASYAGVANSSPRKTSSISSVNSSTWTTVCNVDGDNLASSIRAIFSGTSDSVVVNVVADILVNHAGDIVVKTTSGFYTVLQLRIISDNNANFTLQVKHNGSSSTTLYVEIYPLNSETITFSPGTLYSTATFDHTCSYGSAYSGTGGYGHNIVTNGTFAGGNTTITGFANVTGTFAGGNTTITGFANVTSTLQVGTNTSTFGTAMYVVANGNVGIGASSPSHPLQVNGIEVAAKFVGSQAGYTQGAIVSHSGTDSTPSARGQGMFLFNEGNDTTWYVGTNYQSADTFSINRKGSTTVLDTATAQLGYSLFTIANTGSVGIGTTTPSSILHAVGSQANVIIENSSVSLSGLRVRYGTNNTHGFNFLYQPNDATCYIDSVYQASSGTVYGDIYFRQNVGGTQTTHMTIKADGGNVGIGTSSPQQKFVVSNGGALGFEFVPASGIMQSYNRSTSAYGTLRFDTAELIFHTGNTTTITERARVAANGNFGVGNNAPAYKLHVQGDAYVSGTITEASSIEIKENVVPIEDALSVVQALQGVIYDRKDGSSKNEPGLIAEDTDKWLSSVVTYDADGNPTGIKYTKIVPYLIESIKQLKSQIDQLSK